MDAVERPDGVQEPGRPRTEAEMRAEHRSSKRAEALRANLKRRKSQLRARAEAGQEVLPEDIGTARSRG